MPSEIDPDLRGQNGKNSSDTCQITLVDHNNKSYIDDIPRPVIKEAIPPSSEVYFLIICNRVLWRMGY